LILRVGDVLAGYALVARATAPPFLLSRAQLELRKFYIDSAYHGRGVAQALMKEVLAIGSEEDDGRFWLSVFSDNERAISFYTKHGFRIAGAQEFVIGADRQKDYLMLREELINERKSPDGNE
jgi:ribosomal protein S18 acetylase RimI-like enzyme